MIERFEFLEDKFRNTLSDIDDTLQKKFGEVAYNRIRGDGLGVVCGFSCSALVGGIIYSRMDGVIPIGIIAVVSFIEGLRLSIHARDLKRNNP